MTLRKIAGLGALLSLQTSGSRLTQETTLDSGDMPRMHSAIGPLPFVAIPGLTSALCTVASDGVGASAGCRSRLADVLFSFIRAGIPIRGST